MCALLLVTTLSAQDVSSALYEPRLKKTFRQSDIKRIDQYAVFIIITRDSNENPVLGVYFSVPDETVRIFYDDIHIEGMDQRGEPISLRRAVESWTEFIAVTSNGGCGVTRIGVYNIPPTRDFDLVHVRISRGGVTEEFRLFEQKRQNERNGQGP
jgi:hypothetical protein